MGVLEIKEFRGNQSLSYWFFRVFFFFFGFVALKTKHLYLEKLSVRKVLLKSFIIIHLAAGSRVRAAILLLPSACQGQTNPSAQDAKNPRRTGAVRAPTLSSQSPLF